MEKIKFNSEESLFPQLGIGDSQEALDALAKKGSEIVSDFYEKAQAAVQEGDEHAKVKRADLAAAIQDNFSYGEILFFALNHFEGALQEYGKQIAMQQFLEALAAGDDEQPQAAEQTEEKGE